MFNEQKTLQLKVNNEQKIIQLFKCKVKVEYILTELEN